MTQLFSPLFLIVAAEPSRHLIMMYYMCACIRAFRSALAN